ncbi:MAG: DNRLRE domain-containing protein, partial [Clostridia bacterium]|nr:DNRLRE domain-containing protein [Clostridia bacterium]
MKKKGIEKMKKFFSNFIHNTKLHTKAISCLLILLLFFYAIPTVIYGEVADAIAAAGEDIAATPDESAAVAEAPDIYSYEGVAYEAVELREESAKHFHLEDGSYVAAQYAYPVHIADEGGKLIDINNTLAEASGGVYANPSARIKFAKKITGNGNLFTLHDGNTKLTFSLVGAIKKTAGEVTNGSDAECETELQKMMNLEGLTSRIIYRDILEGVDVEYVAESLNIKENIIVKQRAEGYSYTFELGLNGLTAALADGGAIVITNTSSGKVQYTIPAPVVYDANYVHAPASAAGYTLLDGGNGKYTLTVSVSDEWMNSEDRAYPVTVDPTVTNTSAANNTIVDTYVDGLNKTTSYGTSLYFSVNISRTAYWKITTLPNVPSSARVSNVSLNFYSYGNTSKPLVGMYRVLEDWDDTITYQAKLDNPSIGRIDTSVLDYKRAPSGKYVAFNVTPLWYDWNYNDNFGVAFKTLESVNRTINFRSANSSTNKPYLSVSYSFNKGLEDYWSTLTHSVGVAGNGYVKPSTGAVILGIPTLTT